MKFLSIYEEFSKERHNLSGVILIVEDRILLVHPKKFRFSENKWSIPKGHVEGKSLKSALCELREETGIKIKHKPETNFNFKYLKNGVKKNLKIYVYHMKKSDLQKYFKKDSEWEIKSNFDRKEIHQVKFFKLHKAGRKLETKLKGILKPLKKKHLKNIYSQEIFYAG